MKQTESAINKVYILEGLGCSNCAAKIEEEVGMLSGVSQAAVNFVLKTLSVELNDDTQANSLYGQVDAIVKRHEPDIVLQEKASRIPGEKTIYLEGLSCAVCAEKIAAAVNDLAGVRSARTDFFSQTLTIEAEDQKDLAVLARQAGELAVRIEPQITVSYHKKKEIQEPSAAKKETRKKTVLFAGTILFVIAVVFSFSSLVELGLFVAAYLLIGGQVVGRAFQNIARGQVFDENFLMTLATVGAFAIGEYPEGVAVMLFYQIGELFQDMAVNHSRKSISSLMDIRPDYANLKVGDEIRTVSPEEVGVGNLIVIKPGERVPLDGYVAEGQSTLDTSALTGESVPRPVSVGSEVLSGTVNQQGLLTIEVSKEYGDSTVSKILDLVENASSKKAPTERFITKFARYYTPVVVFAALALAFLPPLLVPGAIFSDWVNRALVFLVVSCPCALVISIPLGFFGGIGGASKNGILVKGGNYLEALNNVESVVFDKTGTLTKGVFQVTEVICAGSFTESELLYYAAHAESYSLHPIAVSIKKAYINEIDLRKLEGYEEISGQGIKVKIDGKTVLAGNGRLMEQEDIDWRTYQTSGTVVYLAVDGQYAGAIVIADEIKPDSKQAIKELKALGVKQIAMLTGDSQAVGEKVAAELRLDSYYAELLPQHKVEILEQLAAQKKTSGQLVFVGDGINDAPVLARADIGVAMGGLGSDAAIEAADVVLMTDEPSKLVTAIHIAQKTHKIVWQNISLALGVKAVILVLGAMGLATMWMAVFGDVGVALIAILNALRAMQV